MSNHAHQKQLQKLVGNSDVFCKQKINVIPLLFFFYRYYTLKNPTIWMDKNSQTCSNDHLYKVTTHLRWPMLSLPKPISIKSILHKTTNCLMQPATILHSEWTRTVMNLFKRPPLYDDHSPKITNAEPTQANIHKINTVQGLF